VRRWHAAVRAKGCISACRGMPAGGEAACVRAVCAAEGVVNVRMLYAAQIDLRVFLLKMSAVRVALPMSSIHLHAHCPRHPPSAAHHESARLRQHRTTRRACLPRVRDCPSRTGRLW